MKVGVVAALAVGWLFGFALGGLGPRRDVAALQTEVDQLRVQLEDSNRSNFMGSLLRELTDGSGPPSQAGPALPPSQESASQTPGASAGPAQRPDPVLGKSGADGTTAQGSGDVAVIGSDRARGIDGPSAAPTELAPADTPPVRRPGRKWLGGGSGKQMVANLQQAAEVQAVRVAASRATLIEQANLSPEQVVQLDGSLDRMNDRLASVGERAAELVVEERQPSPSEILGFGHEISGVLLEHQQALDELVTHNQDPAQVDERARQIWNYVDPGRLVPVLEARLNETSHGAPTNTTGGVQAQ